MKTLIKSKLFFYITAVFGGLAITIFLKTAQNEPELNEMESLEQPGQPFKSGSESISTINRKTAHFKTTKACEPETIIREIYKEVTGPTLPEPAVTASTNNKSKDFKLMESKELPVAINLYSKPATDTEASIDTSEIEEPDAGQARATPFGRMVKCKLVNTLESGNPQTPIIALVTEDVCWNQAIILPAMTEIHGKAAQKNLRDRIVSQESWTAILPEESKSIALRGWALDRDDKDGQGQTFGLTDGSYGIKGIRIKSEQLEELKLFAATFIGAATAGLQDREPQGGLFGGTKVKSSTRDAALGGLTAVMEKQADRLQQEIQENGFYTQVPAGKQFYLYVEQIINT